MTCAPPNDPFSWNRLLGPCGTIFAYANDVGGSVGAEEEKGAGDRGGEGRSVGFGNGEDYDGEFFFLAGVREEGQGQGKGKSCPVTIGRECCGEPERWAR